MGNKTQGVHLVAVEQHVHLHQLGGMIALQLIVQGGIAFGPGLQGIEKIVDDLIDGHGVVELHQVGVQILHIPELRPPLLTHGHDVAHIVRRRDDGHLGIGLPGLQNGPGVRVVVGIVHVDHRAVGLGNLIDHRGQGGDEVQAELPLQPFLNDLHVEHPQKAAPEAEAQSHGGLRLEGQGGVVELELLQGVPQVGILGAVLGVDAAVDHGLGGAVAGQGLGRRSLGSGDGVAHPGVLHVLDGGGKIAHLPGDELPAGLHADGQQVAALQHLVLGARGHQLDRHPRPDGPLHHPEVDDDPPVGVVLAVEDQGPEGGPGIALGGGHVGYDILQHRRDVDAHLGGDFRRVLGGQADDVLDLILHLPGIGGGQVDLVDDRQDLQIVLHGQVGVGQSLGLDALGGVHNEQGALAGRQGPGHLIVEVHMARGVDQVELIALAVPGLVGQPDRPCLDGDAPLSLQVHVVQQLALHLPLGYGVARLDQPVGQRGLAVVNVGDDAEISNLRLVGQSLHLSVCMPWPDGAIGRPPGGRPSGG